MEHLKFFDLPADPFQNEADARFYYESAPQKRARLRLLRGVHQKKALSVLTGGPGLGKTTLAHSLLRGLDPKEYAAHYLSIPHESCASGWFLPNVARAIGVKTPAAQMQTLVDQIHTQLVAVASGRRAVVLLVDEAQLFSRREAMEEFRGLLNLLHAGKKLVSLVLFGLRELGDTLRLDPPLAQRVEIKVELTAMDWLESQAYVAHRLRLAGAAQAVFAPDALEALFRWSGGVPRVLNTLADNSLFEAFLSEARPVDSSIVGAAAESLGLTMYPMDDPYPSMPSLPPAAPAKTAVPDWLEPVAPTPDITLPPASQAFSEAESELSFGEDTTDAARRDTVVEAITAPAYEAEEELEIEPEPAEVADFELEEVLAEDTSPVLEALEAEAEAEPEPEEAAFEIEELAPEPEPAIAAPDDSDWSLGSLLTEEDPPEDLAAIVVPTRRSAPAPAPARTLEQQRNEDSFDLRSLVQEVDAEPEPARDGEDVDALFDEIQLED
jgi:general secretion pathway protein A